MTVPHSTESPLRAALENIKDMLGETLNEDFGFWSSPTNNARRAFVWGSYKAAEAALAVAPQEQDGIVWREGASAPEDGIEIIVGVSYRYSLYKPDGRRQMRASVRWQCMDQSIRNPMRYALAICAAGLVQVFQGGPDKTFTNTMFASGCLAAALVLLIAYVKDK